MTSTNTIDRLIALAIAASVALLWEVASRRSWIDPLVFPAPSIILGDFPRLWRNGLLANLGITLGRLGISLLAGGLPGVLIGVIIGWSYRLRRIADPFIAAIHPIPKIILFPLFIVVFGVSDISKIAAVSLTVFFPCLINAAAGVRQISPLYFEVVRSYGGGRIARLWHVVLPGSLPMILSGLRIAANLGLLVMIAIEFSVAAPGIGSILWVSWQTLRIEDLYACVVTLSLVGLAMNATLEWAARVFVPWARN